MKSTKCGPSHSFTLMIFLMHFKKLSDTREIIHKVCSNIEQKGVAQLLQIEEVRLKSSRRCGFSNHHMHKKLVFF